MDKGDKIMGKYCPQCGHQAGENANFCMQCGFAFNAASSQTQQPAPVINGKEWVLNSGVVNPFPVAGYEKYNPTFRCRCEYCYFEFDYHVYDLGYRSWYKHGFVYCPRCAKPLRHRLEFEVINAQGQSPAPGVPAPAPAKAASADEDAATAAVIAATVTTAIT